MLQNWGEMTKAQDDAQKITEAIEQAISAHEADPESHMGAGESIENHRENEIIDHPQGSIPADKRSVGQLVITTAFESMQGWTIDSYSSGNEFGNLFFSTSTDVNNTSLVWLEGGVAVRTDEFDKHAMFETAFSMYGGANGLWEMGLALNGSVVDWIGIGFRVDGSTMYALFNDGATLHTQEILTVSKYPTYIVRAFVNKSLNKVEFWVNGILYHSFDFEQYYAYDETMSPFFSVKKISGTGTVGLNVNTLTVSRDY
jgi:hypothetical protein